MNTYLFCWLFPNSPLPDFAHPSAMSDSVCLPYSLAALRAGQKYFGAYQFMFLLIWMKWDIFSYVHESFDYLLWIACPYIMPISYRFWIFFLDLSLFKTPIRKINGLSLLYCRYFSQFFKILSMMHFDIKSFPFLCGWCNHSFLL